MKRQCFVWLVFISFLLFGCGMFELKPETAVTATNTGESDIPATVAAQVQATVAAQNPDAPTKTADLPLTPTPSLAVTTVVTPIATSSDSTMTPVWGEAYCSQEVPLCIRPYAVEAQGDEQVLRVEIWGTSSTPFARGRDVLWSWRANSESYENEFGDKCGFDYSRFPIYQADFGHLSDVCFRMDERPQELQLEMQVPGRVIEVPFTVGENLKPAGGWNHFTGAQPLEEGATLRVGSATVTLNSVEEHDDFLLLEVTIAAPPEGKLLVRSPDWIVVGPQLQFATVDELGRRGGWHEGRMRAYEPLVGGEIEDGETQQGFVVLQKAAADWGLLILYGSINAETDGVILRPAADQ